MYKIIFNSKALALCLGMSDDEESTAEEKINTVFSDGRTASKFSEHWGAPLYGYDVATNNNEKASDGVMVNKKKGSPPPRISVKTLTKHGVKFQQSKYIGIGRTCTKNDLLTSLSYNYITYVMDVMDFPYVYSTYVLHEQLVECVVYDKLTFGGWNRNQYYNNVFDKPFEELIFKEILAEQLSSIS